MRSGPSPSAGALEVQILPPQPLPAEPAEPAPQRQSRVARAPEPAPPGSARAQPDRAPGLPELASAGTSVADLADESQSQPAETPPSIPTLAKGGGPKEESAGAEAPSPSVNAAYLRNPGPRYPDAARREGEQGTVTLRVLVTREGLPTRVQVEKSSGSTHLDHAALEALKAWRFTPARKGGERIESWLLVPVVFRLEPASP